ncbi:dienelactone hydrolase family protein [Terasakiella sp. A23]|uniref:alpha/beta hydrolase family protein n=1 Tax=Terasakiella sp. FCG-A23 TaxID=3080561 RepID=UPI002953EC73|nr:alpha/beta fold hydrolase [Terasakiella sp. A23]MDV7341689.1 dienelactone hydrolase family protein [Terasakiella sp. A23]
MTFSAGFSTFRASDPDGSIACALWYPTELAAVTTRHGIYDFSVVKNGPIADGQFPLIMMSHGSGGTRFGHCKTAEFFAQNGFIVVAPEHPFNNFFDDSQVGSARSYSSRSRHMKSSLDAFLAHEKWAPSVDLEKIAVFGFSLGGFTALTCVGARPYVEGLRMHLRTNREFDATFCGYEVIVRDGFDDPYLPTTPDDRYKACIALAPVSGGLFHTESLADISVPVQIYRAERDMILRNPFHAQEIRDHLPAGCDYHVTEKAGHFSYLSPVREEVRAELGELANDMDGFDRESVHKKIHQEMIDFLNKALS